MIDLIFQYIFFISSSPSTFVQNYMKQWQSINFELDLKTFNFFAPHFNKNNLQIETQNVKV